MTASTNTKKLHALMKRHRLSARDVAALTGRKINTVRVWRVAATPRPIPDDTLKLLALTLARGRKAVTSGASA